MADVTIADALALFTKVNTKLMDRVSKLEKTSKDTNVAAKKEPGKVLEEAVPVQVESFGKKAIQDLSKIIGKVQPMEKKEELPKKKGKGLLDWLLGALGLLGAGLASLYDKIKDFVQKKLLGAISKAIDILKQGVMGLFNGLKRGWTAIKGVFRNISKGLIGGVKWVSDKIKSALTKIRESRFGKAVSNFFTKMGERISSFADKVVDGAKVLGQKVLEKFNQAKDALKNLTAKATEAVFGKAGQRTVLGKAVDVTKGAAKAVGGAVVKGATAVGDTAKAAGGTLARGARAAGGVAVSAGRAVKSGANIIAQFTKKLGGLKFTASLFGKILKRVPILGGLIEGFLTNSDIKDMVEKHLKDPSKYTEEMLYNDIGLRISEGIGGVIGTTGGAALGAAVGSVIPGFGTFVGAIGGGIAGDFFGRKLFSAISKSIGGDTSKEIGKFIYDRAYKDGKSVQGSLTTEPLDVEEVDDAAIYPGGDKIVKPHPDDSIYAMKEGGPLDKFFNKNIKVSQEGNNILKTYAENTSDIMSKQLKLLSDNNKLLSTLVEKLNSPVNVVSRPTVIRNTFGLGGDLRAIQGVNSPTN